jgi:hypothetical protein
MRDVFWFDDSQKHCRLLVGVIVGIGTTVIGLQN